MCESAAKSFVSRAGIKIEHALREFELDVTSFVCADFGCNIGGFTDCLLQHGAAQVYAVDTGYGTLAWKLRTDPRVVVMERTNALHVQPPTLVDLAVIDLAWTPQRLSIPAALKWLKPAGAIITLVKPHYELSENEKRAWLRDGRLAHEQALQVLHRVIDDMPSLGAQPVEHTQSPITGSKSSRKARTQGGIAPGNIEFLVLAKPIEQELKR